MLPREKMEILIFALIAAYNVHRQHERVVVEPKEFPPFDLQALTFNGPTIESGARIISGPLL